MILVHELQVDVHLGSFYLPNKYELEKLMILNGIEHIPVINKINHIYVQSENDKKNFNKLTNQPISIMGNLKFDARPPENIIYKIKKLKSQLRIDKKFVIVVSSSRDGEEDIVLNFFKRINLKNIVIIIVPRHPERFNEVVLNLTIFTVLSSFSF